MVIINDPSNWKELERYVLINMSEASAAKFSLRTRLFYLHTCVSILRDILAKPFTGLQHAIFGGEVVIFSGECIKDFHVYGGFKVYFCFQLVFKGCAYCVFMLSTYYLHQEINFL